MSGSFIAVQWNLNKKIYDALLLAGVGLYLGLFIGVGGWLVPDLTFEILRIRAVGSCALLMLTLILTIGPAARLDQRFLPILYNRRHFGVLTALVALSHFYYVLDWYHGQGKLPPLVSLFASSAHWSSFTGFPFEILGLGALLILAVMAATSHDFWLAFLSPPVWKRIHMLVYAAFALALMHVALGVMQSEHSPLILAMPVAALAVVGLLHYRAGSAEAARDAAGGAGEWLEVPDPAGVELGRARIVIPAAGERIAVFRHDRGFSAVVNVCAHQNGPLGEGRIMDGCITCPWHGFQFRPEDGCSPPPFKNKIATYRLRVREGRLEVEAWPLAPGTLVEPVRLP